MNAPECFYKKLTWVLIPLIFAIPTSGYFIGDQIVPSSYAQKSDLDKFEENVNKKIEKLTIKVDANKSQLDKNDVPELKQSIRDLNDKIDKNEEKNQKRSELTSAQLAQITLRLCKATGECS